MRIVLATGIYPPDIGGPASFVRSLARDLTQRGEEPIVVCYGDASTLIDEGWEVRVVSRQGNVLGRYLRYAWEVWKIARRSQIVFLQGPVSEGFPGTIGARLAGTPIVMKIVGDYAWEVYQRSVEHPELLDDFIQHRHQSKIRVLEYLERWSIQSAKQIITPSAYLKKIVERWGGLSERIRVIYNEAHLPKMYSSRQELRTRFGVNEQKIMLAVGRAVPWKEVDFLISLLTRLPPEMILVHIGDGPELSVWNKAVEDLDLQARVRFLGKLDQTAVAEWYLAADVFVLPSSYEGFPHTAIEALSMGVPCVVSDKGGNPELHKFVTEGVRVVPYRDTDAWVLALTTPLPSTITFIKQDSTSMMESYYTLLKTYAKTI